MAQAKYFFILVFALLCGIGEMFASQQSSISANFISQENVSGSAFGSLKSPAATTEGLQQLPSKNITVEENITILPLFDTETESEKLQQTLANDEPANSGSLATTISFPPLFIILAKKNTEKLSITNTPIFSGDDDVCATLGTPIFLAVRSLRV